MWVLSNLSHNSVNAIATKVHCWMRFDGDQNAPNAALHPSLCPPPLATPFGCTTAVLGEWNSWPTLGELGSKTFRTIPGIVWHKDNAADGKKDCELLTTHTCKHTHINICIYTHTRLLSGGRTLLLGTYTSMWASVWSRQRARGAARGGVACDKSSCLLFD